MSQLTISVAESATCGNLAARFGEIPGASNYFKGGLVAYSPDIKIEFLHIDSDVIDTPEECSKQMAQGIAELFDTRLGIGTSGYATPYAPKNVDQAFICFAIYDREHGFLETGCIKNTLHLGRSDFQKHVAALVYNKVGTNYKLVVNP